MWLGPATKVPFNPNRFGVVPDAFSHFRWFWDYAGGMMTDWGVHLIDIVQMAMNVDAPLEVSTIGGKFHLTDNRDTPDTIIATYRYPDFVMTYENRVCNGMPINGRYYGIEFLGTKATLFVDRERYELRPEPAPGTRVQDIVPVAPTVVARDRARRAPVAPAQLHRLREVAPGADLRHRDRPPLVVDGDPRQHGAALRPDGGLGRQGREGDQRQRQGAGAGRARLSRAVEADRLTVSERPACRARTPRSRRR